MFDHLDIHRATQAAAVLLRDHGDSISPSRLLQLLYLADRTNLSESGWPIVGHQVVASDAGPVHHAVAELISGRQADPIWCGSIQHDSGVVRLVGDPGKGQLSEHNLSVLSAVAEQHRGESDDKLTDFMKSLSEWQKWHWPIGEKVIPYRDILSAIGFSVEDVEEILGEIEEARLMDALHEQHRHSTVQ